MAQVAKIPVFVFAGLGLGLGLGSPGGVRAAPAPDWQPVDGGRSASLEIPSSGRTGFTRLTVAETGVAFTNSLDEWQAASNRVLLNGSGVALGDCDGDGRPDIFLTSLNGRNTLYRNLGGWRFADVTEQSGLKRDPRFHRGAVFADVNGDRALDLLVAVVGRGVECFLNDGRGRFTESTASARTAGASGSMTLALADVDGNGTLDLYVANNRGEDIRDRGQANLRLVNGQMVVPPELKDRLTIVNGQVLEYGEADQLYLNDGRGRFTPVPWAGGRFRNESGGPLSAPPLDWGLSATFRDINGDGHPDLYVCNDFWTPDRVWINDGRGRFQAAPRLAFRNMCASSMGVDFADIDRDGFPDCFVVDMLSRDPRLRKRQAFAQRPMEGSVGAMDDRPQFMRNTLHWNRGDGTFTELANYAGVAASDWSWSPVFLDVDLDGYEDLLITCGHAKDVQDLDAQAQIRARQRSWKGFASEADRQKAFTQELMEHMRLYPGLEMPIVAFRNRGDLRFEEVTSAWGTGDAAVHHAIATADLDGDGDLDLVVNNLGSPAGVYRNESAAPRVAVRLKGASPNTQAIGARVSLLGGAVARQSQEVVSGGRYLAGSDPELVFAAGAVNRGMTLEVKWRSGRQSRLSGVRANRVYEMAEPTSAAPQASVAPSAGVPAVAARTATSLFVDVTARLNHRHYEVAFDDFALQPLLPFKLSQAGPGVGFFDLDGDGADELFVGAGRGGMTAVFRANGKGVFEPVSMDGPGTPLPDDTSGMAGWVTASGVRTLLVGLAGYEDPSASGVAGLRRIGSRWIQTNLLARPGTGVGALAVADVDGDGDLDLFAGGGGLPGRYPEAGTSGIFRCTGERLELDSENSSLLSKAGLVNGAVWSDLDGDGYPELILACEWGPIRVFANKAGRLSEATDAFGLAGFRGWWRGVTTGDIDGDGRLDILAANWGLNSPYRATPEAPLRLYFGDLADRGTQDLLETESDPEGGWVAPRRSLDGLAAGLPFLRERFASHKAFSAASVADVLGDRRGRAREESVTTLASTLFLNRSNRFIAMPLPTEAQLAPAFSVNVADADGDGNEDVFLAQNFFATQPETPRLDAGWGLWIRGLGGGKLDALAPLESGVDVAGEQRGAALGDFDRDGRIDLIVSQNGGASRLFRNQAARPGLKVRLAGPAGNPDGIGAALRLRTGNRWGPVREVHGGSGYRSIDSALSILATPESPDEILVLWPGGRRTTARIPAGATEIIVGPDGLIAPRKP